MLRDLVVGSDSVNSGDIRDGWSRGDVPLR